MNDLVQQMIDYIKSEIVRRPQIQIDEDTPLISSGLIDSFSLISVLLKLEEVTKMRIPPGKVQPKDMNTIRLMFETAQRAGKPKAS